MKKRENGLPGTNSLRQKAEKKLKNQKSPVPDIVSDNEALKLFHELQVYQLQIEMQNEELRAALAKAETATALYDFAPVGYYTLLKDGIIAELNLRGASLLGRERSKLINKNIRRFITQKTIPVFDDFLQIVCDTNSLQNCEVELNTDRDGYLTVHIEGITSGDKEKCLITAVDITQRKITET